MGNKGSGNMSVGNRTQPPPVIPPATVTAANEGLSLSGTTVQLGNASALSLLPQITGNRHIPVTGGSTVNFNSSNIVTPANRFSFSPARAELLWNSGASQPSFQISDNTVANKNSGIWTPDSLSIQKGTAGGANPTVNLIDNVLVFSSTLTSKSLAISGDAGPLINATGVNAAGAVLASQFVNTSTAAAASVVSQWFVNSTVRDFKIIKYSDANVASGNAGGVDLLHVNATVPAAALRLMASSTSATIQSVIGGNIYLNVANRVITIGDFSNTGNTTKLFIDDVAQALRFANGGQFKLNFDIPANTYSIGDISNVTTFTTLTVDVNNSRVIINSNTAAGTVLQVGSIATSKGIITLAGNTSGIIAIQPQAAAGTYNFNLPVTSGGAGDILTSGGGGAAPMVFVTQASLTGLPYIKTGGTSTATAAIILSLAGNSVSFQNTGNTFFSIDTVTGIYAIGDISGAVNSTRITVNDTIQRVTLRASNGVFFSGDSVMLHSSTSLADGAAASIGTLTNAPAAGNPTKWIHLDDNGTTRFIPAW